MTSSNDTIDIELSGRLHNIADLQRELDLNSNDTNELLRAGWLRWKTDLAIHLTGDYALAIRDASQRLTYLVRNPLGVKPLYYRLDKARLSYGFSIPGLQKRCQAPLTRDMDWAAAYLLHLSFSTTETAYREIKKVPPGHWLSCDAEGRINVRRYHEWRDDAVHTSTRRDEKWVEAYREVLEEAIRCRMDPDAPMGTENSGGIDSATITAYLAHFLGEPGDRLHSFGFALCDQEPEYILKTSQALRIRHNYIMTDRYGYANQSEHIRFGLSILGYPEEHGNATSHIPFYLECKQRGIATLFSGFGGEYRGYQATDMILRKELLDHKDYAALWNILPGDPLRRSLRMMKAATVGHRNSAYNPNFLKAWKQRWPSQLLRPEVVQRLNLQERYMETAVYDAPYRRINDFILNHHLKGMQLTARLENCTLMAAAYGIDYRWPLWDVRLVQQYLSTPGIEKVGPKGIGRYLHRRAIDKVVPRKVAWKPSKDMGYARLKQEMNHSGIQQIAREASRLEASLHPGLDSLIDRNKLREQIKRAERGGAEAGFAFFFRRSVDALHWLNEWLQD